MKEEKIASILKEISRIKGIIRNYNYEPRNIAISIYYVGILSKLEKDLTLALT